MRPNAAPRLEFNGWKSASPRPAVIIPEQMPQHLPIIYTLASTGPYDEVVYGYGDALKSIFGQDFLNMRAPHVTHTTPLIDVLNRRANKMGIIRLKAPGSARARIAMGLEILATDVPLYELDADGYPKRVNGQLIETGEVAAGFQMRWVKITIPADAVFGRLTKLPGTMSVGGVQSEIYPIYEMLAAHDGQPGNLIGHRIYAPTTNSLTPLDTELVEDQRSMLYRLQIVQKLTPRSSPVVWETLSFEQEVQFALNPDAINEAFDSELFADRVISASYRNMELNESGVRTYGPFEKVHFYHNNIATISAMVQEAESVYGKVSADPEHLYMVNVIGFKLPNGAPYQSVQLMGPLQGGLEVSELATHYLEGGSSGTMSNQVLDDLVRDELLNFGNGAIKWKNWAKYPGHHFYDTGFSLDVKKLIPRITAVRKNMAVYTATHIAGRPDQTMAEESSMIVALNASMQGYPESAFHGTSFARGCICAGSGDYALDPRYPDRCPSTLDIADKKAQYQGASNGAWSSDAAYDEEGKNVVTVLKNVSNSYRPDDVRNKDWANNAIYWQDYDRSQAFYPGMQTAFSDDSSPMNSEMVMSAMLWLTTVTFLVWRSYTGNQKLTPEQLIERSDERIIKLTQDMFDGRFVIRPETTLTDYDKKLGYSWSSNIRIYASNMRTVFAATVIAHSMEDLNNV